MKHVYHEHGNIVTMLYHELIGFPEVAKVPHVHEILFVNYVNYIMVLCSLTA